MFVFKQQIKGMKCHFKTQPNTLCDGIEVLAVSAWHLASKGVPGKEGTSFLSMKLPMMLCIALRNKEKICPCTLWIIISMFSPEYIQYLPWSTAIPHVMRGWGYTICSWIVFFFFFWAFKHSCASIKSTLYDDSY